MVCNRFPFFHKLLSITIGDWILENLPFGHIGQADVIIHISKEKESFGVKCHSKKV